MTNPEQRVWLASILSAVILVGYAQVLTKTSRQTPPQSESPALSKAPAQPRKIESPIPRLLAEEEPVVLESNSLRVELGKSLAAIRSVTLKEFEDLETKTSLKMGMRSGVLMAWLGETQAPWILTEQQLRRAVWKSGDSQELLIELDERAPKLVLTLTSENHSSTEQRIPVTAVAVWSRGDKMAGQYNMLEASIKTTRTSSWQRSYLRYLEGAREPKIVPRGTSLVTLAERFFCQAIKLDPTAPATVSVIPSEQGTIAAELKSSLVVPKESRASYDLEVYLGPRDFFHLRSVGFEQAFPIGFLGQIGLMLMVALKGIAALVRNYGMAVIVLAAGVTAALSPFTLISVRSMKRMQELQPRMDQLKKKHADDPKRMNKEVFALFKEHKVSPLSGCLPMLLQLPVFFALWSAISHVVELRGARFLWIKDLSLPDRLAKLPLGLDLNILPILMAAAMFMQTKLSQPKVRQAGPNPFSGPLMSVIFGVMFYQVPAGLVLYWLTNSLVSVLWYKIAKV